MSKKARRRRPTEYPKALYLACVPRSGEEEPLYVCALSAAGRRVKSREHKIPLAAWQRYAWQPDGQEPEELVEPPVQRRQDRRIAAREGPGSADAEMSPPGDPRPA